ncbi:hypothetical protein DC363_13840 [Thalassorhabdomicrobium marinisediminis]|uniref:Uncharacterized protein n=1 Tax=Thalassorhabdomicrobium marinisediminis TaxID=2170577 RepID=A0A2T7FUQ1_9RHOB|nr:hypothetical protein DC363_13840 [Thalassorhabdomicrobium marinisediminis]
MVQGDSGALILQFAPHVVEIGRDGRLEVRDVKDPEEAARIAESLASNLAVELIDPEQGVPEAGPDMEW